ncbi:MAG: solute:sodium symporter family transporter [bacterium]
MNLSPVDLLAFVVFIVVVIGVSLYASRREVGTTGYFLAGRGLSWWLIGFSLIASNISTEQFVGMSGSAFGQLGLAVASYEWFAAVTLVVVALFLLPRWLRLGIFTMPEFLEYRYGAAPRVLMAVYLLIMYICVALASILYSGGLVLQILFGFDLIQGIWLIGLLAGAYTIYGGLKAVVWSDLLQGGALLLGGLVVMVLGFEATGGVGDFFAANEDKLHLVMPADNPDIPWTALLFGAWIPHFFYWGFNQFITQRTLAARSVRDGQNGVLLAAGLKLVLPFIVVLPGIMAFQLAAAGELDIGQADSAYPALIQHVLPAGFRGFLLAALFGAVMSSLDSMLNSASSIFTLDLFKRHFRPSADSRQLVRVGRMVTGLVVVAGCLVAPNLANPEFKGVFNYIQMFQGFISPGIVTVFGFGLIFRRAPASAALAAMLCNIPVYGLLLWWLPEVAFLNHMGITFAILVTIMAIITWRLPLARPVRFQTRSELDLTPSPLAKLAGLEICLVVAGLYIVFW